MFQHAMREQWYQAQAEAQAISCWLNCYLREFALPRGQADFHYRGLDGPAALLHGERQRLLRIRFAEAGYLICVRVVRTSLLGRCEYQSAPYLKSPGTPWHCANANTTAHFLLERLAPECGFNAELLAQSNNSVAITAHLLHRAEQAEGEHAVARGDALIEAEQSMLWGHALHPTPKSREGLDIEQVMDCSPEARTRFPLHWFRIDPRLLKRFGRCMSRTLGTLAGLENLYPCHPWEVERLLANPLMQHAQSQGWITSLGSLGEPLWPTSSVRTLYHPQSDYFLKLSIHVRLTNCVRKNAWYELESAVALTQLLAPVSRDISICVPGFEVLLEPAASTLDFSRLCADRAGHEADSIRELGESFGILYRENIPALARERYRPQVAGALFANDRLGVSFCRGAIQRFAAKQKCDYQHAATQWFEAYASVLLDGVWMAFFKHGVVLEPHLQNTLIGFDGGLPTHIWIRDLEGTKLIQSHWPEEKLVHLSSVARASLYYTQAQGWKRVAYCALVNNLAEAIFHLTSLPMTSAQQKADRETASDPEALERRLWNIVSKITQRFQRRFGAQPLLQGLLEGDALPSKNNLRLRLFKRADRHADYNDLPSPMRVSRIRYAAA